MSDRYQIEFEKFNLEWLCTIKDNVTGVKANGKGATKGEAQEFTFLELKKGINLFESND